MEIQMKISYLWRNTKASILITTLTAHLNNTFFKTVFAQILPSFPMFYRVTRKSGTEEIPQDEEISYQQDPQYYQN